MAGNPGPGSNPVLTIDCTALNVADPAGIAANNIVMATDPFQVSADWTFAGFLASWLVALNIPYTVIYYYEGIGGGPEGTLGSVANNTVAGQTAYGAADTTLNVAPNTLASGTYIVTAVVSFNGNPPVTAFTEGPMLQVF
jgi:hypothetical protein